MVAIFFLYFLYSIVFILGKYAIEISKPIFFTGIRMIVAGILSYMIHCFLYEIPSFSKINRKDMFFIVGLGVCNIYMTNAGEFWSLQYLSSGKVSFFYNFTPFFTVIFSLLWLEEKINWQKIIGMIIGFISLIPILQQQSELIDITFHYRWLSVAEGVMICASMAAGLGFVWMKYLIDKGFTPFFLNGLSMVLGGVFCIMHALLFEKLPFVKSGYIGSFIGYMLLIMFIQNLFAYNLHSYLLRYYTTTLIAFFSFVMPLMTIGMGYMFLGEIITIKFCVCSVGVGLGLFIFYREKLKFI